VTYFYQKLNVFKFLSAEGEERISVAMTRKGVTHSDYGNVIG